MVNSKQPYRFGPFTLSPSERSLRRKRRAICLDSILFDLLLLFVENAGKVISKDEMIARVWEGQIVEEGTIFTTISRLRKVLKAGGRSRRVYIQTVSKKGYCFVCPVTVSGDMEPARTIEVVESTSPLIDSGNHLQQLVLAVGLIGLRLGRVESVLSQSSAMIGDNAKVNVIDLLNESQKARVFFDLAQNARQELTGAEQNTTLDAIEAEHANVLASLHYYGNRDSDAARELEMAISLSRFWDIRGYWAEGRDALQRALARQQPGEPDLLAQGMARLGYFYYALDDYKQGEEVLADSMAISRSIGDRECFAFASNCRALIVEAQGRFQEANRLLAESLKTSRAAGTEVLTGWILRSQGLVAEGMGNYAKAKEFYQKSLGVRRDVQDLRGVAAVLNNLGSIALVGKDHSAARRFYDQSLELSRAGRNTEETATCSVNLGLSEESTGKYPAAIALFQQGLTLHQEVGDKRGIAKTMEAIARANAALGKERDAARTFGAADAIRISIAAPLSPAEQAHYGQLRTSLKKRFPQQWSEGAQEPDRPVRPHR